MTNAFSSSFEIIFAAFYQFQGKILIPLMLENLKLWRTKSGIYTWNLKSLFHNVILLVILEFSCHVWFKILLLGGKKKRKKKRNPKLILSTICKRSLKQIKFSWKGNGRKGDGSMYLLYIRLLAVLYIFAFVLVKQVLPLTPWKAYAGTCIIWNAFVSRALKLIIYASSGDKGAKQILKRDPATHPSKNHVVNLTSFL